MKRILAAGFIAAGRFVAGCAKNPARADFMARETKRLESYCAGNAVVAGDAFAVSTVGPSKRCVFFARRECRAHVLRRSFAATCDGDGTVPFSPTWQLPITTGLIRP